MRDLAVALRVPQSEIQMEIESRDTKDQALKIKELVDNQPFLLVTSAYHMPRAVALFEHQGLKPKPVPVGHLIKKDHADLPARLYPFAGKIILAEKMIREWLGLTWAKIRKQV